MTDSGGIQEEASSIGKPIILMRETTERPEGIYVGTIQRIGVKYDDIINAVDKVIINSIMNSNSTLNTLKYNNLFGDGHASSRIANIFNDFIFERERKSINCTTNYIQDKLAEHVFSLIQENNNKAINQSLPWSFYNETDDEENSKFITKAFDSYKKRKELLLNQTRPVNALTMQEIFNLSSKYRISSKNDEEFSLTAIVGLYKRVGLVNRWIKSLLEQSHPPKIIWFVFFASPVSTEIEKELENARNETFNINGVNKTVENLFINKGQMQLKYFGRFQLALQTTTKYVIVFDDDCIPQPRYIEAALHTINTEEYHGIIGTKGTPFTENKYIGPVSRTERITEIDVVGGSWLMESEWVKLMFRDKMFTWATGEDWHLSVNARRYANLRSFVMPVDPKDSSTHSFPNDYMQISMKGDTTGYISGSWDARKHLKHSEFLRGDRLMDSYAKNEKTVMLFVENNEDAIFLVSTIHNLFPEKLDICISVSNNSTARVDVKHLQKIHNNIRAFNDFMMGRDYNVKLTKIAQTAEIMYHFNMAIQQNQATGLLVVGSSASESTVGVAVGAQLINVPIINFIVESEVKDKLTNDLIKNIATFNVFVNSDRQLAQKEKHIFINSLRLLYT
jgi:hypothetical protein